LLSCKAAAVQTARSEMRLLLRVLNGATAGDHTSVSPTLE